MSFTVKTYKDDPEVVLYNELFFDLKAALKESYETTEPYEYDPDGYLQIDNESFSIGIAFVAKQEEPLTFNIEFEKPYKHQVLFSNLPEEEQIKIFSIFKAVFNEYSLEKNNVKESN